MTSIDPSKIQDFKAIIKDSRQKRMGSTNPIINCKGDDTRHPLAIFII